MSSNRGSNLSPEARDERWAIVHGWRLAGVTFPEIARRLGIGRATIEGWYRNEFSRRMVYPAPTVAIRDARCLRCCGEFRSEGAHNRLCDDCRAWSASPMAPEPGGHPGRRAGRPR